MKDSKTPCLLKTKDRAAFNQNEVDPTCRLCCCEGETLPHFLLRCPAQKALRDSCMPEIIYELRALGVRYHKLTMHQKVKLLIDSTTLVHSEHKLTNLKIKPDSLYKLEELCRRFVFLLHSNRYRELALVPKRKAKRARAHHKTK